MQMTVGVFLEEVVERRGPDDQTEIVVAVVVAVAVSIVERWTVEVWESLLDSYFAGGPVWPFP